jgi:hypothetical protein
LCLTNTIRKKLIQNVLEKTIKEGDNPVWIDWFFTRWYITHQNSVGLYSRVKKRGHDPRKLNTSYKQLQTGVREKAKVETKGESVTKSRR